MQVESFQCPQCGAMLNVEGGHGTVFCNFCGASLKITIGSSGNPVAALSDIKADTSILAINAALAQLDEKLEQQAAKRQSLANQRNSLGNTVSEATDASSKVRTNWIGAGFSALVGGVLAVLAVVGGLRWTGVGADGVYFCGGPFFALAIVLAVMAVNRAPGVSGPQMKGLREEVERLDRHLQKCDADIRESCRKRQELVRKMEELTDRL